MSDQIIFKTAAPGSTIGVIAPASSAESQRFESAVKVVESAGYKLRVALDPCKAYGSSEFLFSSAKLRERITGLHELFEDDEVSVILAVRGGYGSMELLSGIDWELLARKPKLLIGFSDVTALLLAVYKNCPGSLIAVHGPGLTSLAPGGGEVLLDTNSTVLFNFISKGLLDYSKAPELSKLCGRDSARGRLIGGSLSMITALLGTPFDPDFNDHLLVLEEVGERPYRVHRMLLQLELAGKLSGLQGVLLGSFHNCSFSEGPQIKEVFLNIFEKYDFPVYTGAPFGHHGLNFPLPYGVEATISNNHLELTSDFVLS